MQNYFLNIGAISSHVHDTHDILLLLRRAEHFAALVVEELLSALPDGSGGELEQMGEK